MRVGKPYARHRAVPPVETTAGGDDPAIEGNIKRFLLDPWRSS